MNKTFIELEHKCFSTNPVKRFKVIINNSNISIFSKNQFLYLEILGKKECQKLTEIFFEIYELLFLYLGSYPTIRYIFENDNRININNLISKFQSQKEFYQSYMVLAPLCAQTINEKLIKEYKALPQIPISSFEYLSSEKYRDIMIQHRFTLLLHITDALVTDKTTIDKAQGDIFNKYHNKKGANNWTSYKNVSPLLAKEYFLCEKYFFKYHKNFNCRILPLLKYTKWSFVKSLADTRHSYSHFLTKSNTIEKGDDLVFIYFLLTFIIRLYLIDELSIPVNEDRVKEFYYVIHDWISETKGKEEIKSKAYKNKIHYEFK